jgi:hypothetical protein
MKKLILVALLALQGCASMGELEWVDEDPRESCSMRNVSYQLLIVTCGPVQPLQ